MNRKTILTASTLAALAATALMAGCSSRSSPPPGVALTSAARDPVVEYKQYQIDSQLAEGLIYAGGAVMSIDDYYGLHGSLPASNAQAENGWKSDLRFDGPGKFAGGATVGPKPGWVTIKWARGALAGKMLVLSPSREARSGNLCFRVDPSTTVPAAVLTAHGRIAGECLSDE